MPIKVTIKIPGITRMRKAIENNPRLNAAIADAWSKIYRSFTRLRFVKFSRGGGSWATLKPSTLKRRRKGKGTGNAAILRDTGALFASLAPELGNGGLMLTRPRQPIGFEARLQGGRQNKSGATLADVASYHHFGEGNLPESTTEAKTL